MSRKLFISSVHSIIISPLKLVTLVIVGTEERNVEFQKNNCAEIMDDPILLV